MPIALALLVGLAGCATDQPRRPMASSEGPQTQAQEPTNPASRSVVSREDLEQAAPPSGTGLEGPEVYRGSGQMVRRGPEPGEAELGVSGEVTLNFANADIREVVDVVLGRTLGVNYVIDPRVQGTVTARTSRPLAPDDVVPALEHILALSGAALVIENNLYKVTLLQEAAASLSVPVVAPLPDSAGRGYGIYIVPLRYASAQGIADVLQPFVPPGRILRVDASRNLLIFAGTGAEARELIATVETFDVDWMAGMSFGLFPLQAAAPKVLIEELETIFLQEDSPLAGIVRFVPIERLNAVLAITPRLSYLDRVETWIERLDRGGAGAGRRIFVYHLQNTRAADIAAVLGSIFEGSTGATRSRAAGEALAPGLMPATLGAPAPQVSPRRQPSVSGRQLTQPAQPAQPAEGGESAAAPEPEIEGPAPAAEAPPPPQFAATSGVRRNLDAGIGLSEDTGDIRIIADETNNALVILASAAEYRMIEATLKRLDLQPLQVLIEATIAEVSLSDDLRYGVEWFFRSGNSSVTFSTLDSGAVSSAFPGFSYLLSAGDARVVLNALTEVTDVKVISSPQLMVLDNKTARLQVGDQVPVATQSAVSVTDPDAPVVNSIQFRDTGVILEVSPRANAGGLVSLEILQEVSDVKTTTTSSLNSPTIEQRSIESTVAVQSGNTVVLGGLIRDRDEVSTSGVPILSDIPILGNLFKVTDNAVERTELLVLITPRVVRNQEDANAVTDDLRRRMRSLEPLRQKIKEPAPAPEMEPSS